MSRVAVSHEKSRIQGESSDETPAETSQPFAETEDPGRGWIPDTLPAAVPKAAVAGGRSTPDTLPIGDVPTPADDDDDDDDDSLGTIDVAAGSSAPEPAASHSSEALPFQSWDRYTIVAFLGAGGMGAVYKALDPRLNRSVAIKFLRSGQVDAFDTRQRRHFQREARAQALIEHPHICKIYEVGEIEGQPYIAMQHIHGSSLGGLQQVMMREDKVRAIQKVAEALHAAHTKHLIHRDLKPGNIMVERRPDGTWWPYLMDFGLAKEVDSSTQTSTGGTEGTPAFMAPEQARGETRLLDARTDIYGLGATLYSTLSGRPPFVGNSVDVMIAVLMDDPPRLRTLDPAIPSALETIVHKCLEKDPKRRYDSAQALYEELGRFLEGARIEAKPPGLLRQAGRVIRRHKLLFASVGAALIASIILGSVALRARWQAEAQARQAQELGQVIKELELFMRSAYGLPTHDIRREQAIVRQRMTRLREQLKRTSPSMTGALRYALGRGHLVLREYAEAQVELERGWHEGYRSPEARLALGLTLGERYRQELEQARRATDPKWVEAKEKELQARYLRPALAFLEGASSPLEAPAFVEGLVALYSKKYEQALGKAREAQQQAPWLAEPLKLEGDVYQEQAVELMEHGQYKVAVGKLRSAVDRHQAAAQIGSSDSAIHESEAADWLWLLATKEHTGEAIGETVDRATAACDRGLVSNPTVASIYQTKASVYWRSAILSLNQNQNPIEFVKNSIDASQKAIALDPDNWLSHYGIGVASGLLIQQQFNESALSERTVNTAISALRAAIRLNPNAHWAWGDLGGIYMFRMIHEMQHGDFKKDLYDSFISSAEAAVKLRPDIGNPLAPLSYGSSLVAEFHLSNGLPHDHYVTATIRYAKQGLTINPSEMNHVNNEATGHLIAATSQVLRGEDPAAELATAERLIVRSLKLNPQYSETHQLATRLSYLRAWQDFRKGRSPQAAIEHGLAAVARGEQISKEDSTLLLYKARLHGLLGQAQHDEAALALARTAASQAAKLAPKQPEVQEVLCEAYRHSAALRLGQSKLSPKNRAEASDWIAQGLAACDAALALNPRRASAHGHRGALLLLQAQQPGNTSPAKQRAAEAAQALQKSIEMNRWLAAEYEPLIAAAQGLTKSSEIPSAPAK